jgi:hypothetical protein
MIRRTFLKLAAVALLHPALNWCPPSWRGRVVGITYWLRPFDPDELANGGHAHCYQYRLEYEDGSVQVFHPARM